MGRVVASNERELWGGYTQHIFGWPFVYFARLRFLCSAFETLSAALCSEKQVHSCKNNTFRKSYLSRLLLKVNLSPIRVEGVRERVERQNDVETGADKCLKRERI